MPRSIWRPALIHGCVLCKQGAPVLLHRDVRPPHAGDQIAGWIYRHGVDPATRFSYTRTADIGDVIKTVRMGIPILVSRRRFTAWAIWHGRSDALIGRARGNGSSALSGRSGSSTTRTWRSSRKNPRAISAKAANVTIKVPGVLLAGDWRVRMGGGDKPMRQIGGAPSSNS